MLVVGGQAPSFQTELSSIARQRGLRSNPRLAHFKVEQSRGPQTSLAKVIPKMRTQKYLHRQHTPLTRTKRSNFTMSAVLEATRPAHTKKTFGKSTREVPHHSQKAKKWYPAQDEVVARKVCICYSLRDVGHVI